MISVRDVRIKTGLTQSEFCKRCYNIPVASLRDWEQGRRKCPEYVVRLINFKINNDKMEQE